MPFNFQELTVAGMGPCNASVWHFYAGVNRPLFLSTWCEMLTKRLQLAGFYRNQTAETFYCSLTFVSDISVDIS